MKLIGNTEPDDSSILASVSGAAEDGMRYTFTREWLCLAP